MVQSMKELHELEDAMLKGDGDADSCDDDDDDASAFQGNCDDSHSHSHSHGTTTLGTATGDTKQGSSSESSTLAKAETLQVYRSKLLVLLVLAIAAIGVGVATYIFTRDSETKEFEGKFHDFAIEMEDLIHDEARNVFLTIGNLATTITSEALTSHSTWPFVSVPHFEIRGRETNVLANSLLIAFSPLVQARDKVAYEIYANYMQSWIAEGVEYSLDDLHAEYIRTSNIEEELDPISRFIYKNPESPLFTYEEAYESADAGPYLPVWQQAPAPHDTKVINYNLFDNDVFDRVYRGMTETLHPVLSEATDLEFFYGGSIRDDVTHPHSFLLQPVFQDFITNESSRRNNNASDIVGTVIAILPWDHYYENILPKDATGIVVVMKDSCGDVFSYQVDGPHATFLGYGDFHDPTYASLVEMTKFAPLAEGQQEEALEFSKTQDHCEYELHIYPSSSLEANYRSNKPIIYAALVVTVFFLTAMVFFLYDWLVTQRQNKVMLAAKKSNLVVASLFPKNIRERLLKDVEEQMLVNEKNGVPSGKMKFLGAMPKNDLKNFLDDGIANGDCVPFDTKPIADLFPHTTIMFGDIAGFTAWSSVREPTSVFTLLETLYHAFDEIAKRRRVFKVETIGDCYVAVSGLPEPRKDHASVMARFARDCIGAMNDLTKKLEISLGPDTGDLSLRVGLHSGPVTAGVLRGDKSRFQLFGDTVNTAARMESHGTRNRIHVSKETADLLKSGGKSHWIVARKDTITAKGKGELETFWVDIKKQSSGSQTSGKSAASSEGSLQLQMPHLESLSNKAGNEVPLDAAIPAQLKRRIQWNADILKRMLLQIVARRNAVQEHHRVAGIQTSSSRKGTALGGHNSGQEWEAKATETSAMEEVMEVITLPDYHPEASKYEKTLSETEISPVVIQQLQEYVTVVASLYHQDNAFHNFEHASHVCMSVVKLLARIVAPEDVLQDVTDDNAAADRTLHDHTFGITSDPLTQFAVAFSALIHDVDHQGVPNAQLVKEDSGGIASAYNNQSVAEQNSVDLAWSLLMEDSFKDLRAIIYTTEEERTRFRQLVVNVVLATDICDADLKNLRNGRWAKAFGGEDIRTEADLAIARNRKATIILEHLIQASDVAHTMQHWHIYRKWNELFFEENMQAYQQGRSTKNPADYWYQGELGFFDFYIIPLAKKLKDCGVFGVSSDEYLNYAMKNRKEWELQGKEVVAQMSAKYLPPLLEEGSQDGSLEEEFNRSRVSLGDLSDLDAANEDGLDVV